MFSSVAVRLTAAFSLIVFLIAAGAVALVGRSLRAQLDAELSADIAKNEAGWKNLLEQESRVLQALGNGAAANSTLRERLAEERTGPGELEGLVQEERTLLGANLVALTEPHGGVLATTEAELASQNLFLLLSETGASVLSIGGQPYWIVATPVESRGKVVGYVLIGNPLGAEVLGRLQAQSGSELLLLSNGKVIAEKLRTVRSQALLEALPQVAGAEKIIRLEGKRLRVDRIPAGPGMELVVVLSSEEALEHFRSTLLELISLGLLGTLGAAALAFLLAQRITGPLRQLTAAAEVAAQGDFRGKLQIKSRDEVGRLAEAFARMMEKQRSVLQALRGSAQQLEAAAGNLSQVAQEQNGALTIQAASIQQVQVTARELQATSRSAAERATEVLEGTARAEEANRSGQTALHGTLSGLGTIRMQVEQISQSLQALNERTSEIGIITETVKGLADQSKMVALNASIESVRSGEHGRGFSVVAREIRSLADQSGKATARAAEILGGIGEAIRKAAQSGEAGAHEVDGGLMQMQVTGESLSEVGQLLEKHTAQVRQIARAVAEQDAGIGQIFSAINELNSLADSTVARVSAAEQAAAQLTEASHSLGKLVSQYKL